MGVVACVRPSRRTGECVMSTTCPDRSKLLISQATADLLASYVTMGGDTLLLDALRRDGWDL